MKPFHFNIDPNDNNDNNNKKSNWSAQFVMWPLVDEKLPASMKSPGVERICTLDVNVDNIVDQKLKNRHWYNRGPKYYKARFDLKVKVETAGLEFQLCAKDGTTFQSSHLIHVQWEPMKPVAESARDSGNDRPRMPLQENI